MQTPPAQYRVYQRASLWLVSCGVLLSALAAGPVAAKAVLPSAPSQAGQLAVSRMPVAQAVAQQRSNIAVEGEGQVAKVLPDDRRGIRHQRFILRLADGTTVLVAHNIDLAPRLPELAAGEQVGFVGEYVWNHKGGVVHWTHRDPQLRHPDGWISYRGRIYQ